MIDIGKDLQDAFNDGYNQGLKDGMTSNKEITLAEFLGWEEGKEYRWDGYILKVEENNLLDKRPTGHFFNTCCTTAELIDLRNATKYEPKYYAKIKGYDNPLIKGKERFWNYNHIDNTIFELGKEESFSVKTKLTKTEWAKLNITEENADFEEVEE